MHHVAAAFALLTIFSTVAGARPIDPSCRAQPARDPRIAGRADRVTFPNGRVLTVIGQNHGTRQIYGLMNTEYAHGLKSLGATGLRASLDGILATNRAPLDPVSARTFLRHRPDFAVESATVIGHARRDYDFLRAHASELQFVGFEASHRQLSESFDGYVRTLRSAESAHASAGAAGPSKADVRDALMSSMNGHLFYFVEDPARLRTLPLVGVEDHDAAEAHRDGDAKGGMDAAWDAILALDAKHADDEPEAGLDARSLVDLSNDVNVMAVAPADLDERMRAVRTKTPRWLAASPELDGLFAAMRARVGDNLKRDFASARNMVSRHQTGAYFVGLNHLINVVRNLEEMCTLERTSGPNRAGAAGSPASAH